MILLTACTGQCLPPVTAKSTATVTIDATRVLRPLIDTLFGTNINTGDKGRMAQPDFVSKVKSMGIKSCRFPNGCEADRYNWKSPAANQATVDEALDFCDQIGAEAYYTLNMQGGTEGLRGPVPEGATLDERIKYQHLAPNPCGDLNYYFGTLAETLELVQKYTVDRAIAGRRPITTYEMGNENWGQSTTDWPPDVYARTIDVYATAMRKLVANAASKHPQLKNLRLYIVAVGFPVMGNNMKLTDTPDRKINVAWTSGLNKLHDQGVIDSVQEHFYPYGSANGGTIAWAVHNLHNIIYARKGKANSRLAGYKDPEIAYNMPMEHTEWNVKCWGGYFKEDVQPANGNFETGLDSWTADSCAKLSPDAARRGKAGCVIEVDKDQSCNLMQTVTRPQAAKSFTLGVWIRTDNPEAVKLKLTQKNDGEHAGQAIGEYGPCRKGSWERVMVGGKLFDDTKEVQLTISVTGPASVDVDEAKLYYSTEDRGQVALSATTYEQELLCVDALREMAMGGCPRAHIHHLAGDYPCGSMSGKGEIKDLGKVFQFFAMAYGDQIVQAECKSEVFPYHSSGNSWATDFNALAPNREDIPELGCMASKKGDTLYVLLINRTSDREIDAKINLGANPSNPSASVRTLSGNDIDLPGATLTESEIKVSREFTQPIAPYSAQIITIRL